MAFLVACTPGVKITKQNDYKVSILQKEKTLGNQDKDFIVFTDVWVYKGEKPLYLEYSSTREGNKYSRDSIIKGELKRARKIKRLVNWKVKEYKLIYTRYE